jgi:cytochrome c-type biogenesis protein CcmH
VVVVVVRSRPDNTAAGRAYRLEHELACPVCEGQSVYDSNAPQSEAIREDIPRRIAAGQSDADIRAYYVSRYTSRILETPSNSGLGIVAWGIPALAVILGAAGIVLAVRRWSHTPRLAASDEDEDIVRRAREGDEGEDDDEDDA